jgi:hypothetical protein
MLQWKVFLALLAVVLVGATLGSVLRPTSKPPTLTATFAISAPPGGWANPIPVGPTPQRALFILGPEPKTPLDRLRAWLERTFNK